MDVDKCIVIPAAGASLRLGRPKQLVEFDGQSLIRRAVAEALAALPNVIVVTGCEDVAVRKEVNDFPVVLADNPEWELGMGRSIAVGVQAALDRFRNLEALLVFLCDTPLIRSDHLAKLVEGITTDGIELAFTKYDDTVGTPAMFSRRFFEDLAFLDGDQGAKKIILECEEAAKLAVEFSGDFVDIDLPEDIGEIGA